MGTNHFLQTIQYTEKNTKTQRYTDTQKKIHKNYNLKLATKITSEFYRLTKINQFQCVLRDNRFGIIDYL